MAIKTRPTDVDVTAFLDAVPDERRRAEGHAMRALMERVTGEKAVMWGSTMVGFGSRPYTNTIGTADMFLLGFSPRKGLGSANREKLIATCLRTRARRLVGS